MSDFRQVRPWLGIRTQVIPAGPRTVLGCPSNEEQTDTPALSVNPGARYGKPDTMIAGQEAGQPRPSHPGRSWSWRLAPNCDCLIKLEHGSKLS